MAAHKTYAERVAAVEAEGATTSDAQAVVDAEDMITARRAKKDAKTLPNKVRLHREKANMSPKELAAQIGKDWSASMVRRIERGARRATPAQMAEMATALRKPANVLFPDSRLPTAPAEPQAKPVRGKRTRKVQE